MYIVPMLHSNVGLTISPPSFLQHKPLFCILWGTICVSKQIPKLYKLQRMFFRLLLLFVIVPAIELAILIEIGKDIGFWPTMGIIFLTGAIGSTLTRTQGMAVWSQFNAKLQKGQLPGNELIDGLIVLCSGALLLTPGILTDFVGFLGLIPHSRSLIRNQLQKYLKKTQLQGNIHFQSSVFGAAQSPEPNATPPDPDWQGTPRERPDHTVK